MCIDINVLVKQNYTKAYKSLKIITEVWATINSCNDSYGAGLSMNSM